MKTLLLSALLLVCSTGILPAQTTYNVCCGEVYTAGSCTGGVPHSNAGVFNPANLTINVGDRIRFYTRMELLGGYNGTHDIRFTGSPANNVLLPISTNILARVTNVLTPPFATAGSFPMECVDANHCFAYADLFSGWPCTGYGVTVNTALAIQVPELMLVQQGDFTVLTWESELEDAEIYYVERAGTDFAFQVVDSVTTPSWRCLPPSTPTYFRIAALNSNGDLAYTNVVSTDAAHNPEPMVFPNPCTSELRIGLATGSAETVKIEVRDMNDARVYAQEVPVTALGFLSTRLETAGLACGVYGLRITVGGHTWVRKVVKVE